MKTSATNRKIRVLLVAMRDQTLIPRPEFQRMLVWTDKDKRAFLDTVLSGYPFPEIYVAAGEIDRETAAGTELLVDGQQRLMTLHQYFDGDEMLKLGNEIMPYEELDEEQQKAFLEYEVVVRDLGLLTPEDIREVFRRINSTQYSLNDMELHNARYSGAFIAFGREIADNQFFERHRVFSAAEGRRMQDVRFALVLLITLMSTYFARDDELEEYIRQYNDTFEAEAKLRGEVEKVLSFVESCSFESDQRVWKKADLFTLLVEVHRCIVKDALTLSPRTVKKTLSAFYSAVDKLQSVANGEDDVSKYHKVALQATNDRSSRIVRGDIVRALLLQCQSPPSTTKAGSRR